MQQGACYATFSGARIERKVLEMKTFVPFLAFLAAVGSAQAQLFVDPFLSGSTPSSGEYADGAALDGANPTVNGFDGAWSANNDTNNGQFVTTSGGLTYSGLGTSGGAVDWNRSNSGGGFVANKNWSRNYSGSIAGSTQTEVWGSLLFRYNSTYQGTSNFDYNWGNAFLTPNLVITVDDTNGDSISFATQSANVTLDADTTYLILWKSVGDFANDTLDVWLNPDLSGGESGIGDGNLIDFTGGYRSNDTTVGTALDGSFSFGGGTSQSATYDEFRIGASFADVAPVPEPSAGLLFVIGLGALCLRRRKAERS